MGIQKGISYLNKNLIKLYFQILKTNTFVLDMMKSFS